MLRARPASIFPVETPAAIEMTGTLDGTVPASSASTSAICCGLTARSTRPADPAAWRLSAVVAMPSPASTFRRASTGSEAIICSGLSTFAAMQPRAMASAMFPAPMNASSYLGMRCLRMQRFGQKDLRRGV